jgi:hypothetical protein
MVVCKGTITEVIEMKVETVRVPVYPQIPSIVLSCCRDLWLDILIDHRLACVVRGSTFVLLCVTLSVPCRALSTWGMGYVTGPMRAGRCAGISRKGGQRWQVVDDFWHSVPNTTAIPVVVPAEEPIRTFRVAALKCSDAAA